METDRKALVEKVYAAIEAAQCPHREGPYGLYDYSSYEGDAPPHVVRDFRDMRSSEYGAFVFRSNDAAEARSEFDRLTREHIGLAAIAACETALRESTEPSQERAGEMRPVVARLQQSLDDFAADYNDAVDSEERPDLWDQCVEVPISDVKAIIAALPLPGEAP